MLVFWYGSTDRPTSQEGNVKMTKFLLVLCLLIGAYTVNALDIPDDLDEASFIDDLKNQFMIIKQKISNLVKNAINSINDALKKAKGNLPQWIEDAKNKVENLTKEVSGFISGALKQMDQDIDNWIAEAEKEGANAAECRKIANPVRQAAINVAVNTTNCITHKFEDGLVYIQDIEKIASVVYDKLVIINKEAAMCFSKVDGMKDTIIALNCVTTIYKQSSPIITDDVPRAVGDIVQLKLLILELMPEMTYCVSHTALASVKQDIKDIAIQVKSCVESKISEINVIPAAA